MSEISGWFETDEGIEFVEVGPVSGPEGLAWILYSKYGCECVGVDMEFEGDYTDGTPVADTMSELLDDLLFIAG